jgi:hypothetical protein
MATCDYCGSKFPCPGTTVGLLHYCNEECAARGKFKLGLDGPEEVTEQVRIVHGGRCPKCGSRGPVDIHMSYKVWSAIFLTVWRTKRELCCRPCGLQSQLESLLSCFLLGWWGIPFGLIVTPIQVLRNVLAMVIGPDPLYPSAALRQRVREAMDRQSGPGCPPRRTARGMASYPAMRSAPPAGVRPVKVYYEHAAADRNGNS